MSCLPGRQSALMDWLSLTCSCCHHIVMVELCCLLPAGIGRKSQSTWQAPMEGEYCQIKNSLRRTSFEFCTLHQLLSYLCDGELGTMYGLQQWWQKEYDKVSITCFCEWLCFSRKIMTKSQILSVVYTHVHLTAQLIGKYFSSIILCSMLEALMPYWCFNHSSLYITFNLWAQLTT